MAVPHPKDLHTVEEAIVTIHQDKTHLPAQTTAPDTDTTITQLDGTTPTNNTISTAGRKRSVSLTRTKQATIHKRQKLSPRSKSSTSYTTLQQELTPTDKYHSAMEYSRDYSRPTFHYIQEFEKPIAPKGKQPHKGGDKNKSMIKTRHQLKVSPRLSTLYAYFRPQFYYSQEYEDLATAPKEKQPLTGWGQVNKGKKTTHYTTHNTAEDSNATHQTPIPDTNRPLHPKSERIKGQINKNCLQPARKSPPANNSGRQYHPIKLTIYISSRDCKFATLSHMDISKTLRTAPTNDFKYTITSSNILVWCSNQQQKRADLKIKNIAGIKVTAQGYWTIYRMRNSKSRQNNTRQLQKNQDAKQQNIRRDAITIWQWNCRGLLVNHPELVMAITEAHHHHHLTSYAYKRLC
ncbi:hypothetical protein CHS0354_009679 [Potamilus streckersoni]|uniref:Uncharacterized protein n=1 Tax=Potamilus streckersoni TaxID=2493646 RepID=A0AAE0SMF2_9BIVA|nr:hypothetical protein CHS0354_009679 [Potamilus streckersoni]